MISFSLLILSPPQDIEAGISRLQSEIFMQYGFASAMAFPVMLPLCPVPDSVSELQVRKAIVALPFAGFPVATANITDADGSIFLTVKETKNLTFFTVQCRELMQKLQTKDEGHEQPPREKVNIFPFYRGFFLAQNESKIPENELTGKIVPPLLDFGFFTVSLLKIHIHSGISAWWENLDWEIPFAVNCRKTDALKQSGYRQ